VLQAAVQNPDRCEQQFSLAAHAFSRRFVETIFRKIVIEDAAFDA
jgi:hypothetical protein